MRCIVPPTPRRPRSLSLLAGAGAGALALVALAGCQPDKGPGSLLVSYELGNNKACDEVGVVSIRADLFTGDYDPMAVDYTEEVSCDAGEVAFDPVEPGVYNIRVSGYDDSGMATFDNLGQIASERRLEIFEAAESTLDAELTARPADLKIGWRLGDGGFGNCAGVGIDRFEIVAYQTGGGSILLETTLACELNGDAQGFRLVEDPDRLLNGVLFGEVGIQALAANGSEVGSPAIHVFEPVGPGYPVELTIECTEAGCTVISP